MLETFGDCTFANFVLLQVKDIHLLFTKLKNERKLAKVQSPNIFENEKLKIRVIFSS